MPSKISRRKLLASGTALAAAGLVPSKSMQETTAKSEPDEVTPELAEPLTGAALEALPDAIQAVKGTSQGRLKHKLQENSEPAIVFKALPAKDRKW